MVKASLLVVEKAQEHGQSRWSWDFSGVNADSYDENGNLIPQIYKEKTRSGRHRELVDFSVSGAIEQARIARDIAGNKAPIHVNILWEMAAAEEILTRTLEKAGNVIDGVTWSWYAIQIVRDSCKYGVYYYPIVSSSRAFNALWKRSYRKTLRLSWRSCL